MEIRTFLPVSLFNFSINNMKGKRERDQEYGKGKINKNMTEEKLT